MSPAPETVLRRVRSVVGTGGLERLDPGGVRLLLGALLFEGAGVPDWHEQAACRDADPELFFPEPSSAAYTETTAAKQVCARCPVRIECLADVTAWERPGHRYGVAGGRTVNERRRLWSRLRDQDTEGGTAA